MAIEKRILITTGDTDGVGWEVTAKALHALGPQKGFQFFFYRHVRNASDKPNVSRRFKHHVSPSLQKAAIVPFDPKTIVEIRSPKPPALWVEEATEQCLHGTFNALVTAPLSKTSIIEAGLRDIGHTEILARVCKTPDLFMGFIGKKFSVLLVTGHQPVKDAVASLSARKLKAALAAATDLRKLLPKPRSVKPLAVLGVNPHAGEQGLIGSEEGWMSGLLASSLKEFGPIAGPLVPDAAFLPQNWNSFSVYVCPYHDQGLIPFKMIHGFKGGVHLTLGLPFVRTSVDHGTAKELYGKNKAEPGSMKDAINTAMRMTKESRNVRN